MDEATLINRAKDGDVTAFNELILLHQEAVYNFALRFSGDPASADDTTQSTFITAYKKLYQFDGATLRPWLIRIVHNKCRDQWRKEKRHPEPSLDEMTEDNPSQSFMASEGATPEGIQEQREMVGAIESCLSGLPQEQRAVVLLRDVEGYDYAEIANVLSVSLGTVKSRLNRARRKLQVCLQDFMELLPSRYRFEGR